jgi:hypothetical protein
MIAEGTALGRALSWTHLVTSLAKPIFVQLIPSGSSSGGRTAFRSGAYPLQPSGIDTDLGTIGAC